MQPTPLTTTRIGVPSPAASLGATGRVTATPASPSSATVSVSGTPKPAPAAATGVATGVASTPATTAPDGTVLLSAPLGLQATVLSQPSFYPSLGEDMGDFAEEGDILFAVLGDPWSRVRCGTHTAAPSAAAAATVRSESAEEETSSTAAAAAAAAAAVASLSSSRLLSGSLSSSTSLCVQPVLTLPRKVGVSLACEIFRALLSFHNAATYPLTQAHLNVGVAQPPAPLRRALIRKTVPVLPPKSNYTVVAAVPLHDASTYSLAVAVDYSDPSGRQRQLTWNSTLKIEQPVMEAQPRSLTYMRQTVNTTASPTSSSSISASRVYAQYQLTVGLRNMSSVPLFVSGVQLVLPALTHHNGRELFCDLTPAPLAAPMTTPLSIFLTPGDTQTCVFDVGVNADEVRHATVVHGPGGTTTRLLSPRLTSFGHVQWSWCRANGEAGTARSAALRVAQLVAEPEVALYVTGVSPALADGEKRDVDDGASPLLLLAGSPVAMELVLVNHSSLHRYDVALKVRVARLAPQWLYTGPTVRLLGPLEAGGRLPFSLTLLPWQGGWLQVLQSALEVVDAAMPEAVLWPPAPAAALQPVDGHGANMGGNAGAAVVKDSEGTSFVATLPVVAQQAMKATLPADGDVLCELLVL